MGIKLDFTGLFVDVFIVSLVLVAIGLSIRSSNPRSAIAIVVIVIGGILALITGVSLVGEPIADWVHQKNNRIYDEDLSEDRTIQGLSLPRGATVGWRGKLMTDVYPAQPLTVSGVAFEREVTFTNRFTNDDRLVSTDVETGTLATDQWIDGVPCQAHKRVEFFGTAATGGEKGRAPNVRLGKLLTCTASATFDFAGNRYLGGAEVKLNSSGRLERGILAMDQDVDGHWCKQGSEVERPDKRASRFTLARAETISGVACKAGTEVRVDSENGRVTSATLAHDQQIGDIPCAGGEAVGFGYGGDPLDECVISRPVTLLNVAWPAGSAVKGLSTSLLDVTLPRGAPDVQFGEVKIVGRCKVTLSKNPPRVRDAAVLKGETGYAELHGMRFTELNISDDLVWGVLAEPATLDGKTYAAGANIRIKAGHPE